MASNLTYGVNMPASNIAQIKLQTDRQRDGTKTWSNLFGMTNLNYQAQKDNLDTAYTDVIRQAYTQNRNQQQQIAGLNLNQGALNTLQQNVNKDLMSAYQQYIANKQENSNTLLQNYASQVNALNTDLLADAENYQKYLAAVEEYRKYLNDTTYMIDNKDKIIGKDENGNPLYEQIETNLLREKGLNYLYKYHDKVDDATVELFKVMGMENALYDYDSMMTLNELQGILLDENGNLTDKGSEYYRTFMNMPGDSLAGTIGFDEYIAQNYPELWEWSQSADPYNYNFKGTKAGSAQLLVGNDSLATTDTNYTAERDKQIADRKTLDTSASAIDKSITTVKRSSSDVSKAGAKAAQVVQEAKDGKYGEKQKQMIIGKDVANYVNTADKNIKADWQNIKNFKDLDAEFWGTYGAEIEKAYNAWRNYKPSNKNIDFVQLYDDYNKLYNDYQKALITFNGAIKNWQKTRPEIDMNKTSKTGF